MRSTPKPIGRGWEADYENGMGVKLLLERQLSARVDTTCGVG